jgi:hypothetical protein
MCQGGRDGRSRTATRHPPPCTHEHVRLVRERLVVSGTLRDDSSAPPPSRRLTVNPAAVSQLILMGSGAAVVWKEEKDAYTPAPSDVEGSTGGGAAVQFSGTVPYPTNSSEYGPLHVVERGCGGGGVLSSHSRSAAGRTWPGSQPRRWRPTHRSER